MADGGGGEKTRQLVERLIVPRFGNPRLGPLDDAAVLPATDRPLCVTTDSYVVVPVEFPGGDIGRLAVCGTVNDLAVGGAEPRWLTMGLIIEEGLEIALLERLLDSAAAAAAAAGVEVVAGDTKVIDRRDAGAPGIMINTAGVGPLRPGAALDAGRIEAGDAILVSGNIADHGIAVMSAREGLAFEAGVGSDVAPLGGLVAALFDSGADVRFLRDPTRGGLAGVAADLVDETGLSPVLDEAAIPVFPATAGAAGMLGLDPLNVANEGVVVAVVAARDLETARAAFRGHARGEHAAIVGRFTDASPPVAELKTVAGGRRVISRPYGEELPRIC